MEISQTLIKYKLTYKTEKVDNRILKYLMWNLFLQADLTLDYETTDFREGQLSIIKNVLARHDTIGLLPTGSGKSICYQLAGILQPAPSIVVAPIVSLMKDQVDELNKFYLTRVATINSTTENKDFFLNKFGESKYFFIFISPERFQNKDFRKNLKTLKKVSYAVIDEAHCLSEWGHDFRTSYLTLVQTIRNFCCKDVAFLALTATASMSVLKDLKIAFDIQDDRNIKTPLDYSRDELEFYVIDTTKKTQKILDEKIKEIENSNDATLIFTPYASEYNYGCQGVAAALSKSHPDKVVKFYHGQLSDQEKEAIQTAFKNNNFNILVATKAFGMGVNKGNIRYTFHYGIPGSLESLYQEAGRAGRSKKLFIKNKAKCYVLFSKENAPEALEKLWDFNTPKDELYRIVKSNVLSQDIKRQMYFVQDEFAGTSKKLVKIKTLINELIKNKGTIKIKNLDEKVFASECIKGVIDLKKVETYLYKIYQLGIITDWVVSYKPKELQTDFSGKLDIKLIRSNCEKQIQKYDYGFAFDKIVDNSDYSIYLDILTEESDEIDKYIKILIEWGFQKFVGYRRQSLKNVYEACDKYITQLKSGEKTEEQISQEFKRNIEGYFTVNEETHKLVYLSEQPEKFEKGFELFYTYDDSNQMTSNFKSSEGVKELKNILMRLLEEQDRNPVLNLVSGLTRFLLDEFDDPDGIGRLRQVLEYIKKNKTEKERKVVLINILKICSQSKNETQKIKLVKTLFEYYNRDEKNVLLINKYLNDNYTNAMLFKYMNTQINEIIKKLI